MAKQLTVGDAMSTSLIVARPEMLVHEATDLLLLHEISGLPVVDDRGNLVGILTERDCLEVVFEAGYFLEGSRPVAEVMTTDVQTVDAASDIIVAIELLRKKPYRRLPVLQGTHLVGLLSRRDVLRVLRELV